MSRIALVHWKREEALERLKCLQQLGYAAEWVAPQGSPGLRVFRNDPPDAFVIDLNRLPSAGQAVAVELRRQTATRRVPILFAGGLPEKVARIQRVLPDAVYAEWDRMADALPKAIREAPTSPLVPGTMDAYSGAALAKKLGLSQGAGVVLVGAPSGFEATLSVKPSQARNAGRVLFFARSLKGLADGFPAAAARVAEGGGLWVVWPKQASGAGGDLTQAAVRRYGLDAGWVDYKICALDETWSGLLFARRSPTGRSARGRTTAPARDSK